MPVTVPLFWLLASKMTSGSLRPLCPYGYPQLNSNTDVRTSEGIGIRVIQESA